MTEFRQKMLDGTPADPEYLQSIAKLVSEVCAIEEQFCWKELEDHATTTHLKE